MVGCNCETRLTAFPTPPTSHLPALYPSRSFSLADSGQKGKRAKDSSQWIHLRHPPLWPPPDTDTVHLSPRSAQSWRVSTRRKDSLGSSTIHEAYDILLRHDSPGPFPFPPTKIPLAHRNNNPTKPPTATRLVAPPLPFAAPTECLVRP